MAISAKQVKKLRDMTGVGMMDCKKALEEAGGDFDEAVELLRKKGQKVAAKRADREASEGLVVSRRNDAGTTGVLVEVNCETDFVARNDEFSEFVESIAEVILEKQPSDIDELEALPFEDDKSVEEAVLEMTGKIGEKIEIGRFEVLSSNGGKVISYIHPGSRLGVLVDIESEEDVEDVGRDVAMQVAALNPVAAHVDEVPEEIKEKERDIARESAVSQGKPEHVIDQIVEGKLKRYYKDHVLVEQPFVKDSSVTVKEVLDKHGASVRSYTRFALGEE